VTRMLKRSILIMVNGDVVIRVRGNNSGSGSTTANNIEAGFEILTDLLVASHFQKYGYFPSYEVVYDQLVKLYGDDNLCGLMLLFELLTDKEWLADRLLRFHGLVLKELYVYYRPGILDTELAGCTFLGFKFFEKGGYWLPRWELSRLLLPVLFTYEHIPNYGIYMQRLFSIYMLVYPYFEEWMQFRIFYMNVITYFSDSNNVGSGEPMVKSFCRLGAPSKDEMDDFYFGLEVGGPKYNLMSRLIKNDQTLSLFAPYFEYNEQTHVWKTTMRSAGVVNDLFIGNDPDPEVSYTLAIQQVNESLVNVWPPPSAVQERVDIIKSIVPDTKIAPEKLEKSLRQAMIFSKRLYCDPVRTDKRVSGEIRDTSKILRQGVKNPYGNEQTAKLRSASELANDPTKPAIGGFNPYGSQQTEPEIEFTLSPGDEFALYEHIEIDRRPCDHVEVNIIDNNPDDEEVDTLLFCYRTVAEVNYKEKQQKEHAKMISRGQTDPILDELDEACDKIYKSRFFTYNTPLEEKRAGISSFSFEIEHLGYEVVCEDWVLTTGTTEMYNRRTGQTKVLSDHDVTVVYELLCKFPSMRFTWSMMQYICVVKNKKAPTYLDGLIERFTKATVVRQNKEFKALLERDLGTGRQQPVFESEVDESIKNFELLNFPKPSAPSSSCVKKPIPRVPGTKDEYGNRNWVVDLLLRLVLPPYGFNPYGNQQPGGKKSAFLAKMRKAGLNAKASEAAWLANAPPKRRAMNRAPARKTGGGGRERTPIPNRRPKTPGKNSSPFDTRPEGPPGKVVTGNMLATLPGASKFQGQGDNKMSPCGMRYLEFLTHPFKVIDGRSSKWYEKQQPGDKEDPCIPTYPCSNSRKYWTITRINVVSSNSTGGLAIMFAPARLANDHTTTNNRDCPVISTNALWPGSGTIFPACDDFQAIVAPTLGVDMNNINSEFASVDLAFASNQLSKMNVLKYRVVYAGIRFKYIGTAMNLAGTCFMVQTPNHESLNSLSTTNLSQIPGFVEVDITRQWHELSYVPVDEKDYSYLADYCVNTASVTLGNASNVQSPDSIGHYLGFLVFGSVPSSPFAVELITGYELIGNAVGGKTPSSSDINAISSIASVLTPSTTSIIDKDPTILEKMATKAPNGASELAKHVTKGGDTGAIIDSLLDVAKKEIPNLLAFA
jgi:hypothetical protein